MFPRRNRIACDVLFYDIWITTIHRNHIMLEFLILDLCRTVFIEIFEPSRRVLNFTAQECPILNRNTDEFNKVKVTGEVAII